MHIMYRHAYKSKTRACFIYTVKCPLILNSLAFEQCGGHHDKSKDKAKTSNQSCYNLMQNCLWPSHSMRTIWC